MFTGMSLAMCSSSSRKGNMVRHFIFIGHPTTDKNYGIAMVVVALPHPLSSYKITSTSLWHHLVCPGEGKVPLILSHWEYLFSLAKFQCSWLRKARGMARHILQYCLSLPCHPIVCGVESQRNVVPPSMMVGHGN